MTGTKHQAKFLFGGDMEAAGWEARLKQPRFKEAVKGVNFFIVSHHGHESGFSKALYAAMGKPHAENRIRERALLWNQLRSKPRLGVGECIYRDPTPTMLVGSSE
jgi:hypothetical protein